MAAVKPEPTPVNRIGPWTWEDFVALPDDDKRELIDGHLLEVDAPTYDHEAIVAALIAFIGTWARANGGRVLAYRVEAFEGDRILTPDTFPGLSLPLAELWATGAAPAES